MAIPTTGSLLARRQDQFKELIGNAVKVLGYAKDPLWRDLVSGDAQVKYQGEHGPGRGYLIKKRFVHETGGVIEGGAVNDHVARDGEAVTGISNTQFLQQAVQGWPSALAGGNSQVYGLTCFLYSFRFNIGYTISDLQQEANDANIREIIAPKMRGAAKQIMQWATNQWYSDSTQQYRLGTLPASSSVTFDSSARTISFTPTEDTAWRFQHGHPVDLWSDSTTRVNENSSVRIPLFVENTDYFTGRVTLVTPAVDEVGNSFTWATVFSTSTIGDTAFVTEANQYSASNGHQGMYGYHDFFKAPPAGSTDQTLTHIFGDNAITTSSVDYINVLERSEHKSMYWDNNNDYLTENDLKHILTRVHSALDVYGYYLDTLVGSMGLWDTFDDQLISKERIDRTNRPSTVRGGYNGEFKFTAGGRDYMGSTSQYLEKDRLIGYRRKGNFSIATLPQPKGARRGSIGGNSTGPIPLDFIGGVLNGDGNPQLPVQTVRGTTTVPTEMVQMPAHSVLQFMPMEQIPGLIIDNISNNRVISDSMSA